MDDLYAQWARVYDYFYPDRTAEIDFWARIAQPFGRRLLDLMCGTAEVSLGLARAGYQIVGLDLSASMLSVGTERLSAAADYPARNLRLACATACAIPSRKGAFDFALVGGNGSFNHLDRGQAERALRELRRVLRPGGGMGLELVNPSLLKEIYPERVFGPLRPTPPGVSVEKTSSNCYDADQGLLDIHQVTRYEIDGQAGEFEESFALYVWQPEEVGTMLQEAGFVDAQLYGDYDLAPFERWSSDLLMLASTPGSGPAV
jgi:ubiquinone/menaquinone biosynthesis C-methylase UbiE